MSYRNDFRTSINESSGSYSNLLTTDEKDKKKKKSPGLTVTQNPLYNPTSPSPSPSSLQGKVHDEKDSKRMSRRSSFTFKGMLGRTSEEDDQKHSNLRTSNRPSLIGEETKSGQKKTPSDKKTPTPSKSRANNALLAKNTTEKLTHVAENLFDFIKEYQKCLQETQNVKEKSIQEGMSNEQEWVQNDTDLADHVQKKLIAELGNRWQDLRDKVDEIFDVNAMNFETLAFDEESLTSGTRKSLKATFESCRKSLKQEGKTHLETILEYFEPLVLAPSEEGSIFEDKKNGKIMTQFRSHSESKEMMPIIISKYLQDLEQLVVLLETGAYSLLQGGKHQIDSPLMARAIKFAKEIFKSAKKDDTLALEEDRMKHVDRCCMALATHIMSYAQKLQSLAAQEKLLPTSSQEVSEKLVPPSPQEVSTAARSLMQYILQNESLLYVEGIFRLSGRETESKELWNNLMKSPNLDISNFKLTIHDVAVTLKRLFGEMHLFETSEQETKLLQIGNEINPYDDSKRDETIAKLKELINTLPHYQQQDLKAMMEILYKVQKQYAITRMDVNNLAVVFGPRLYEPRNTKDPMAALKAMEPSRNITAGLIIYHAEIFS